MKRHHQQIIELIEEEAEMLGMDFQNDFYGYYSQNNGCVAVHGEFTEFAQLLINVAEKCGDRNIYHGDTLQYVYNASMTYYWPKLIRMKQLSERHIVKPSNLYKMLQEALDDEEFMQKAEQHFKTLD